jgi:hypothetical protein
LHPPLVLILSFPQPGLDLLRTPALKTPGLLVLTDFVDHVRQAALAMRAGLGVLQGNLDPARRQGRLLVQYQRTIGLESSLDHDFMEAHRSSPLAQKPVSF